MRLRLPRSILLVLALPIAAAAQGPTHAPVVIAPAPHTAATPDAGHSPADQARRATVVAHIGSTTVTVGELEDMLNESPTPVRESYLAPGRMREYVDNFIQSTLLANEARHRGLDRQTATASAIRNILSQRLEQVDVINAVTMETIADADVQAYYQAHLTDYQQPEYRRATVVITDDRAAADQVVTALRALHGDMRRVQALVRDRSTDPATRTRDGDLFYFRRDGSPAGTAQGHPVDPAIAAAAFGLAHEMDVSPPAQIPGGKWAVAVLTGIRPALNRDLSDAGVANSIRGFVLRQRRSERQQQMLADLRTSLHPEIHEDRLDLIHVPAADLGTVPPFGPGGAQRGSMGAPPVPGATPSTTPTGLPGMPMHPSFSTTPPPPAAH